MAEDYVCGGLESTLFGNASVTDGRDGSPSRPPVVLARAVASARRPCPAPPPVTDPLHFLDEKNAVPIMATAWTNFAPPLVEISGGFDHLPRHSPGEGGFRRASLRANRLCHAQTKHPSHHSRHASDSSRESEERRVNDVF